MFRRWDRMSKQFARIGKDIAIAVKSGGPIPENNPALRRVIQNARAVNMPKDKIEAAIKRASGQGAAAYEEILYEGYAPHGVAVLVQADQLGIAIRDVLHTQSAHMRMRRRQRAEEEAQKAPIKMLFPLIFLMFPAIFVILLGPAVFAFLDAMG